MTPFPADVAELIDGYCRSVDAALGERGVDPPTRAQIADDVRVHIHELLAAGPAAPDLARARAVLAGLDAPSDYARQWAREAPSGSAAEGTADRARQGTVLSLAGVAASIGGFIIGMIVVMFENKRGSDGGVGGVIILGTQIIAFICGMFARRTTPGRAALILSVTLTVLILVLAFAS